MLNLYKCKTLLSDTDHPFGSYLFGRPYECLKENKTRIRIWFYFYCNKPRDPISVWIKNDRVKLEPGNNRYIGSFIRGDKTIDTLVFSEHSEKELEKYNFLDLELIKNLDIEYPIDSTSDPVDTINQHMVDLSNQGLFTFSRKWRNDVNNWLNSNLSRTWFFKYKVYRYDFHTNYDREKFAITEEILFDGSDYDNLIEALKAFFEHVKTFEGITQTI